MEFNEETILRLNDLISAYYRMIHKYRENLRKMGNCSHSKTHEYNWLHDNGYGSQSSNTGLRCEACLAVDPYQNGKWHYPEVD